MDEYPSRRVADGQIKMLREEIHDLRQELRMKATHEDVRRVESTVVSRFAELKEALDRRVTIERYRPTELAVGSAVVALCAAVFAFFWKVISGQG